MIATCRGKVNDFAQIFSRKGKWNAGRFRPGKNGFLSIAVQFRDGSITKISYTEFPAFAVPVPEKTIDKRGRVHV